MDLRDDRYLLNLLENAARGLGVRVKFEALGTEEETWMSRGGLCVFEGEKVIFVDPRTDLPNQCVVLAKALCELDLSQIFLLPLVRRFIEDTKK